MSCRSSVLIVLLLALAQSARGQDIDLAYVWEKHPQEITTIETCGTWSLGEESGFYRIISAEFFVGGSRLWVQWMRARDSEGHTEAVNTLSVPDFNDYHAEVSFNGWACTDTAEGIRIQLTVEDDHTATRWAVSIRVLNKPGEYQITKHPFQK